MSLILQCLENAYDKFSGRLAPFMCASSKLTKSGDVNFYSWSTSEVAPRALRESSEDSNGERKNDALTKALQTKEQQDYICGVSSKLTRKEGFPKHKSIYRKQKTTSTSQVDMTELKRQLRRELLEYLKPILESQGI
jgi:hypothetical protein